MKEKYQLHMENVLQNSLIHAELKTLLSQNVGNLYGGCVVGCASKNAMYIASAGTTDGITQISNDALFDIASITKAVLNVLTLREFDEAQLRSYIVEHVPMTGMYRNQITLEHLITFAVEYGENIRLSKAVDYDDMLQQLLHGDLPRIPGPMYRYTNVSSILLGMYLESYFNHQLDQLFLEKILRPLGMNATTFAPHAHSLIVQTESALPLGIVQDEGSRIFGKPNGAAGLFSTAGDILRFGQSFLGDGTYLPKTLIERMSVSQFGSDTALTFGYGMGLRHQNECDLMNEDGTPVTVLKKNGFSGVHMCVLPENDFTFVSLANICFPERPSQEKRDEYTRFHRKVLRIMYEQRKEFLVP